MTTAARRTRRFRPIHFVLSLLLALGGIIGVAAPASAATEIIQGEVSGPGLDPADVTVYLSQELTGNVTTPHGRIFTMFGARSTTLDPSGHFEFTAVPNGDYLVLVTAGNDWVQWIDGITVDGVTDLGSANVVLEPGKLITGTVYDAVNRTTTLPGIEVTAYGAFDYYQEWIAWDIDAGDTPITGSDGTYRIIVPLDDYYEIAAEDVNSPDYIPQSWNHQVPGSGGCGCSGFDPVTISPTGVASPSGPYDFHLIKLTDLFIVPIYAMQWDGSDFEDVDVILEKSVSGTWTLISQSLTDSSGSAVLAGAGDGDYRLRYTLNGVTQIVTLAEDSCGCGGGITYPLDDGGRKVLLSGLTVAGTVYYVELTFAKPATPPSGGGGSSTPPRKPRISTFTLPSPSATPTPTPTPTSSPTPSSSPSSSPSVTPTPTADPTPTGDPGFPWWIILIIVIACGIVILIIVLVVRR